jgi:hypothetical protein
MQFLSSLKGILRYGDEAGAIVINRKGECPIMHSTEFMVSGVALKEDIMVREGFQIVRTKRKKAQKLI